ncbi:MAG: AAA family ATPase [Bacteroidota bacterium]
MKLVLITGPAASGKMTVGSTLAERTGLKLFHNHMSIELVRAFFDFGEKGFSALDQKIRWAIFEEVAKSELPGIIFTLVCDFDDPEDHAYMAEIVEIFKAQEADCYFVELFCQLEERLIRNVQPSRLAAKASKRDLERSKAALLYDESHYRTNSRPGELDFANYLRVDNTTLSPEAVADQIQEAFAI